MFSGFYQDMIPAIDSDTDFHRSIEIKSSQIYTNLYTNNHIYHIYRYYTDILYHYTPYAPFMPYLPTFALKITQM